MSVQTCSGDSASIDDALRQPHAFFGSSSVERGIADVGPILHQPRCPIDPVGDHHVEIREEAARRLVETGALRKGSATFEVGAGRGEVLFVLVDHPGACGGEVGRMSALLPLSAKLIFSSCSNSSIDPSPGSCSQPANALRPSAVMV